MKFPVTLLLLVCLLPMHRSIAQQSEQNIKLRLAQSYEQGGDFENALRQFGELYAKDSANVVYFDGLRRIYMQLKRYDEAIALLQSRLGSAPRDVNLRGQLGSAYYKSGREKEAMDEWNRTIATDSTNPNVYRYVGTLLLENRLLEQTAALYRRARIACKDPNLFTIDLAQLLALSMDYAGATTEFLDWLKLNPVQIGFVESKMISFTGKEDARQKAIETVRAALKKGDDPVYYELLAWLYLEGKDYEAAFDLQKTLDKLSNTNGMRLASFADAAFRDRAYRVAARAYREAINTPLPVQQLPYAKFGYALALKEIGSAGDTLRPLSSGSRTPATESIPGYAGAIAYFEQIIAEYPRTEFSARSYYQIGTIKFEHYFDLDGAIKSFDKVQGELQGTNVIVHDVALKVGQIYVAKGDTARAWQRFTAVMNAPAATPDQQDEATFRAAEVAYFGGRFGEADSLLKSIVINTKADYANDALELLSFLSENSEHSRQALTEFARADFLSRQRKNTEAIPLFLSVVKEYPKSMLVSEAFMKVASLQTQAGLYTDAVASYERMLNEFKGSGISRDRAQFNIGEIYRTGLNDSNKAIAAFEKLLTDYPQSLLATDARKRIRELRGDTL